MWNWVWKLLCRLLLCREPEVHYIGGSDTLPPPLSRERETELLNRLGDKTGQFARNCGFGNIVPGLKCDAVIFALHAFIGFIRVSDDLGRIAALSGLERCALFPNGSSIVGLSCLDQQSP